MDSHRGMRCSSAAYEPYTEPAWTTLQKWRSDAGLGQIAALLRPAGDRNSGGVHELADQPRSEPLVLGALRVPLHPQIERALVVPDRFDHPIGRCGDNGQFAGDGDRLPMVAVNGPLAERPGDRVLTFTPMLIGRRVRAGQMLVEDPAAMQAHELHAETDSQHRSLKLRIKRLEERQLKGLSLMCDRFGLIVSGNPPGLHNRVITSGKDDSVAPINVAWGAVSQTGQQNGQSAGFGDGASALRRGAVTIVANIARDTDEG